MIKIETDIPIKFEPVDPFFDLLHRDASEEVLFHEVKQYLIKNSLKGSYRFGRVGEDGEISLFEQSGYWLIAYTERGEAELLGLFRSYYNATNFFIWNIKHQNSLLDTIDWKSIFEAKI